LPTDHVTLSPAAVRRMRDHFGDKTLQMGHLEEDGSMSIPLDSIIEAVRSLGSRRLNEAMENLKSEQMVSMLESAEALVERISVVGQFGFVGRPILAAGRLLGGQSRLRALLPGIIARPQNQIDPLPNCPKRTCFKLMEWIRGNPEVPDGPWCKDFGTFKLVGHGALPSTFLEMDQPCFG